MSPFYFKEGEKRVEWDGEPKVLKNKYGHDLGVIMLSTGKDAEEASVLVDNSWESAYATYVIWESPSSSGLIFPGSQDTVSGGFKVVDAWTRKTLAKVTHREKPIKGK